MRIKDQLLVPCFSLFFVGLFVPNELFKSLSYLGPAIYFLFAFNRFSLRKPMHPSYLWMAIFFVIHVAAWTYSENSKEALRLIILRLPLLLVPLFIFHSRYLENRKRRKIEFSYIAICLLGGLLGMLYRIHYILHIDNNINWLYNDNLVSIYGLQAVYYGIYLTIASLFLSKSLLDKNQKRKWLISLSLMLCCVFMLLLASRTSLILFFVLNFALAIVYGAKRNRKIIPVFVGLSCAMLLAMFAFFPNTLNRFKSISNADFSFDKKTDYYHFGEELDNSKWNGLNSRLALWTAAIHSSEDHLLFGHGTGDKQDELRKTYEKLGFKLGLERNFGTHNQYLEVLLMFGLIGLSIFLISMLVPIALNFKTGNYLSALILVSFMIAFLTEDFLGRNQGVAIFAFFYSYCASKPESVTAS